MKKNYLLKKLFLCVLTLSSLAGYSQLPAKVLVGYWHNWESLRLTQIDSRYNVIMLSFLEADKNSSQDDNVVGDLEFTPFNAATLKADILTVQAAGKKVLISIGGANGSFKLNNATDKSTFVSKVKTFITDYKVDGIDIDIERSVYICPSGAQSMSTPATHIQYLIEGCQELLAWYKSTYSKKMLLTTAPEVSYTVGGTSPWSTCNGALLPFIEKLRDDLDLLMIQLYNSGSIYAKPGYSWPSNTTSYAQGSADFIIVATEAAIEGFTMQADPLTDGAYSGLPASKIAVALPACSGAGSGYVEPTVIKSAVNYLMGCGTKPGSYTLSKSYPELKGLMTWSINNDAKSTCSGTYTFAQAFSEISCLQVNTEEVVAQKTFSISPNPTDNQVLVSTTESGTLEVYNLNGLLIKQIVINGNTTLNVSDLSNGIYILKIGSAVQKLVKQ